MLAVLLLATIGISIGITKNETKNTNTGDKTMALMNNAQAGASFLGVKPRSSSLMPAAQSGANYLVSGLSSGDGSGTGSGGGTGAGSGYGSGGDTSTPVIDQKLLSEYDQAIGNTEAGVGRLDKTLNSGYTGIDSSYDNALNQLLRNKNLANETYDTNKHGTATEFVGSKNTIGANAGTSLRGLWRLLGSRGASGGSAYRQVAPDAVAREATIQRKGVTDIFGQNNQALDTNWNNFLNEYKNQQESAKAQREAARQALEQSIANKKASLLQILADLKGKRAAAAGGDKVGASQPFIDKANRILDEAANYRIDPIKYITQAYEAPDLSKYTVNPNATPEFNGQSPTNDYYSPYLAALLGKKKQQTVGA